jgi:hypothetical protein
MIAAGSFRADLYYRLRVLEITVPALRDRAADIPLLAQHLLRTTSHALHRDAPVVSDAALELLMHYAWPGNVRELENCLTRALVLARGNVIRPQHIVMATGASTNGTLPTLDAVEGEHVERVMAAAGGRKGEAARILGVSRPPAGSSRSIDCRDARLGAVASHEARSHHRPERDDPARRRRGAAVQQHATYRRVAVAEPSGFRLVARVRGARVAVGHVPLGAGRSRRRQHGAASAR